MYKTIILQQKANVLTLRLDKQCNRKRVPSAGKRVKDTPDPIVRNPTKNKLTATHIHRRLVQTHTGLILATSVSVILYYPYLVDSVSHILLVSFILSDSCRIPWAPREGPNGDLQFRNTLHHIWLWVSTSASMYYWGKSLWCLGDASNYEYSRAPLGIISLIYLRSVMFGSILGLWVIQSPVSRHPNSIGHDFPLCSGPQINSDISWLLLHVLHHHLPSTSCRQVTL